MLDNQQKLYVRFQKHAVLTCIVMSVLLIGYAAYLYPGGEINNSHSEGFDWTRNFFSNLFLPTALNGQPNPGRFWAMAGMACHSLGYGVFFLHTAKKMPSKHPALVLKIVGIADMLFSFLIATPLHDVMIVVSSTLFMLGLFYITLYSFKTKLLWLKIASVLCMLTFYGTLFLYGVGNWGLLALMQKVSFAASMLLVLAMEYATVKEDFTAANVADTKLSEE